MHLFPKSPEAEPRKTIFTRPPLTPGRMVAAIALALAADAIQFALGPFGWTAADQVIDVIAMVSVTLVIGFHPLFLPTFVAEFIPGVGMLPTWTGCVIVAIFLMGNRERKASSPAPTVTPRSDVIDV